MNKKEYTKFLEKIKKITEQFIPLLYNIKYNTYSSLI